MTKIFNEVCTKTSKSEPTIESLDNPFRDWIQDGWESALTTLAKRQALPEAEDTKSLMEAYSQDAGLVVTCYQRARSNEYRTKFRLDILNNILSLDKVDEDGVLYAELLEDLKAEIPYRQLEAMDAIQTDERISALPEDKRQALKRFALAWTAQQAGYELSAAVKKRISRDRTFTGLPLVLQQGRIAGKG